MEESGIVEGIDYGLLEVHLRVADDQGEFGLSEVEDEVRDTVKFPVL